LLDDTSSTQNKTKQNKNIWAKTLSVDGDARRAAETAAAEALALRTLTLPRDPSDIPFGALAQLLDARGRTVANTATAAHLERHIPVVADIEATQTLLADPRRLKTAFSVLFELERRRTAIARATPPRLVDLVVESHLADIVTLRVQAEQALWALVRSLLPMGNQGGGEIVADILQRLEARFGDVFFFFFFLSTIWVFRFHPSCMNCMNCKKKKRNTALFGN
jgi:hypothetical protein